MNSKNHSGLDFPLPKIYFEPVLGKLSYNFSDLFLHKLQNYFSKLDLLVFKKSFVFNIFYLLYCERYERFYYLFNH